MSPPAEIPAERVTFAQICANQTVVASDLVAGCLATAQAAGGRILVRLWAREEDDTHWRLSKAMWVPGSPVYVRRLAAVWVRTFDVLRKERLVEEDLVHADMEDDT